MIRYMRAVLTASSVTNNTHMPSSISDSSHWNRTLVGCCWDRNLSDGKGDKMIFGNEIFCILEWTGLSVWLLYSGMDGSECLAVDWLLMG